MTVANIDVAKPSRMLHGLAMTLTLAVFPLIWVGGLVTTYDAGMAVPDWPGTYGWNMFAYPASTWLFGPFNLLVEHSHRLLGSLAGLLSIGLLLVAYRDDARPWFRWWCVGVLLAVIAQGVLGGVRVLLDQRTFAMIHGCTGPLFFALATATAVMCSPWWLNRIEEPRGSRRLASLALILLLLSYTQLVLGAQLRHVTAAISHSTFVSFVHLHLTLAGLVGVTTLVFTGLSFSIRDTSSRIRYPAAMLVGLVLTQIGLGFGTWIVNYALPWSEMTQSLAGYTIVSKGFWESMIVTAHMATGSLIVSLATMVTVRAWRTCYSTTR
jgi:heme a synthase